MFYDPFRSNARISAKRSQQVREAVSARLGRFGTKVVEQVAELALTPHKLENILQRWNISSQTELNHQLDALAYYIAQSGAEEFIARLRADLAAAMHETVQMNHPETKSGNQQRTDRISTGRYARSVPAPAPKPKPAALELESALSAIEELAPVEVTHAPPAIEELYPDVPPESVVVRELDWIESPNYSGPDRRLGLADRRTHTERRSQIGSVMQNRRFGPHRRSNPKGRRKSDHANRS